MIELSKCPNCAIDDQVTIAGKAFCMRCGTPEQDNAIITAGGSVPAPIPTPAIPSPPTPLIISHGTSASVSRFGSQQPPLVQGVPPSSPITGPVPELVPAPIAPPAPAPAPDPIVVARPMPSQASAQPQNGSTTQAVDNKINALSSELEVPTMPMSQPAVTTGPVITKPAIERPFVSTLPPDVPVVANQTINIATPLDAHQNTPPTAPSPPSMNDISSPSMLSASVMPMTVMSLDKNDAGGFSDEELNSLTATNSDVGSIVPNPPAQPTEIQTGIAPSPNNSLPLEPQDLPSHPQPTLAIANEQPTPEMAMASAASVKGPSKSNKVLKPAGVVVSILLLFITGAYLWSINYSNVVLKIASAKSGVSVSMPGYLPPGYSLSGDIKTNPGAVSYNLVNNNKKIILSQSKTDWDSQALSEKYVSTKSENYLALQAQGLTIFIIGDKQANWVNQGVWYKLDISDQALTQDQIIKMATSL